MQYVSKNPFITTFQLSSAASLNFGESQNGVIGNGLRLGPMKGGMLIKYLKTEV